MPKFRTDTDSRTQYEFGIKVIGRCLIVLHWDQPYPRVFIMPEAPPSPAGVPLVTFLMKCSPSMHEVIVICIMIRNPLSHLQRDIIQQLSLIFALFESKVYVFVSKVLLLNKNNSNFSPELTF